MRLTGMQEAVTTVDGRPVRSRSTGTATGLPDVVIVPGLGAPSYVEPWAREIGRWTRATVLDLPGWRAGRGRASPSTVAGVARATAGWLRATEARDVVLVGHSSGAQSALRAALAVPDRLTGLVLAGPTLAPAARRPLALVGRFLATIHREQWSEVPVVVPWHLRGAFGWLRLVRSVVRDQPEAVVGQLAVPVLVVTGELDRFAPPGWARHLAGLADAGYATLPGAHNACFTAPRPAADAVHDAVRRWTAAGSRRRRPG